MSNLWKTPARCKFSRRTAVKVRSRIHRRITFEPGTVNADIGGGPYDLNTEVLAKRRVKNVVFDPVNRSAAHNAAAAKKIAGGKADTATVSNVLNVIPDVGCRHIVVQQAADAVADDGTAYFIVYAGNRSGRRKKTRYGWQENRRLASYVPEVKAVFEDVKVKSGVIIARKPRRP